MLHDSRKATLVTILTLSLLASAPTVATLLTGPFQVCPESTITVATDGTTFFLSNGAEYAVPGILQPTAGFSFSVPTSRLLQAVAAVPDLSCTGTEVYLFEIPEIAGQPLQAILTPLCLPNRLAGECHYSGLSTSSPQEISAFIQQRLPTSTDQYITWVDRNTGAFSSTPLTHQIDGGPALRWAPSGNAAFVQHDLLAGAGNSDWMLIDMCTSSMGSRLANFADLGAGASASVVQTDPGVFVARVSHASLPGGDSDVSLVDCLSTPPPPPDRARLEVRTEGDGGGLVDGAPLISCDSDGNPNRCIADWPIDHVVTLTAHPHPGSTFLGWSGDCAGSGNVMVTMDQDKLCIAEFDAEIADLGVDAAVSGDVVAGSPLVFDVQVSNAGPEAASATLSAVIPAAARFDGLSSTAGCGASGQLVTCSLGQLVAGANVPVVIATDLDPDARQAEQATFQVSGTGMDGNLANDQRVLDLVPAARVDLALDMRAVGGASGGLAAWQLEVQNSGPSSALAPDIVALLPDGARPLGDPDSSQVTCTPPRIAPGASALLTVMTRLDADLAAGTPLQGSAEVTAVEADQAPGNDQDSAALTVSPAPPSPAPGELRRIAFEGDQPAGAPGAFAGFAAPAVDGEAVAFEVRYGAGAARGLYVKLGSGEAAPVIDWSKMSADGADTVLAASEPSLDGGRLAAAVRLEDGGRHFYATDDCGPRRLDAEGGVLGGTLRADSAAYLTTASLNERVVVHAGGVDQTIAAVDDTMLGGVAAFDYFGERPAWDGQTAAFFGGTWDLSAEGIFVWDAAGGLRALADRSTIIPGRAETFAGFKQQLDIDGGLVAFIGLDAEGREGLYAGDVSDLGLQAVADALHPALGAGGVDVLPTSFADSYPSVHGGQVAFYGGAPGQPFGLYIGAASVGGAADAGPARLVVSAGDDLGGGFIAGGMLFGPQGFDGERLAFQTLGFQPLLSFAQAIYVVELGQVEIFADGFEGGDLSGWSAALP